LLRATAEKYAAKANECERVAEQTADAESRKLMFDLAKKWRKLAREDEADRPRASTE
jgi:hypothetical protein